MPKTPSPSQAFKPARLFSAAGLSEKEREVRVTSTLLSVMSIVPAFGYELLKDFGAPKGRVDAYTEVDFPGTEGKANARHDGLVTVDGRGAPWSALVEVKTGITPLDPDQVANTVTNARTHRHNAVLTISNQLAEGAGMHPTYKIDSRSKVRPYHLSWSHVISVLVSAKRKQLTDDTEQSRILDELLLFLYEPNSGVTQFKNMGKYWKQLLDRVRQQEALRKDDAMVVSVASHWAQMAQHLAFTLSAHADTDVAVKIASNLLKSESLGATIRSQIVEEQSLAATLEVPSRGCIIELDINLQNLCSRIQITVTPPSDMGDKAKTTWLRTRLEHATSDLLVGRSGGRGRTKPRTSPLQSLRDDPKAFAVETGVPIRSFALAHTQVMSPKKRSQDGNDFVSSVAAQLNQFYDTVAAPTHPKKTRGKKPKSNPMPAALGAVISSSPEAEADSHETVETKGNTPVSV